MSVLNNNNTNLVKFTDQDQVNEPNQITPEDLVDRFRRQGLLDTLRRDLIKEFQSSELKSTFEKKLEDIVLDKLAYDARRLKNDHVSRLGSNSRRTSNDFKIGLSATKERHEDVLQEIERHSLYDRTMSDMEARFVDREAIKYKLYDVLDEFRPPTKRRRVSQSQEEPSKTVTISKVEKESPNSIPNSEPVEENSNAHETSQNVQLGLDQSSDLDGMPLNSNNLTDADEAKGSNTQDLEREGPCSSPEKSPGEGRDSSTRPSLSSAAPHSSVPPIVTSNGYDGDAVSSNNSATCAPRPGSVRQALELLMASARRESMDQSDQASASTNLDGAPLPSSSLTDSPAEVQPSESSAALNRIIPTSSSLAPEKPASSSALTAKSTTVSLPEQDDGKDDGDVDDDLCAALHKRKLAAESNSTRSKLTINLSKPSSKLTPRIPPQPSASDCAIDGHSVDSAVTEFLRSLGPPPEQEGEEAADEDKAQSVVSSDIDGASLSSAISASNRPQDESHPPSNKNSD
ncbi:uncharacterized protein MELLADRAFT_115488 [Melampsora larici-populina 98AG31]|uniref:BOD1/SHG1 domain-containing protein n=1 Tax=Melampsora larici-populina (strain 98AG31 / pathotype 3-4-7) TaxID=747676 RepID=F4R9W8_MELLP|nr:uncharacterized protein MELLADRAFT_115488 [Melampsora larici-populina 98AG31]EGG10667.1 hypothetical protein MELLADRAFT_115488 [Melampsora larici-populina 98AG31]